MRYFFSALLIFTGLSFAAAQPADSLCLMPRPASVKLQAGKFIFTPQFSIGIEGPVSNKLTAAVNRFYQNLGKRTGIYFSQEYITAADNKPDAQLVIRYRTSASPQVGMDESYNISIKPEAITLDAATDIGALRGIETLYQLIMPMNTGYYCPLAEISDSPRFKWRGLMIDAARHFIPVTVIKRNIDAMAAVKMNVLHLHLSDDEGFRVESKIYPLLQQKGSNGLYYKQEEIADMVSYAHDRGIIVVPEFDLPGHSTSILAAYPSLASYPYNYKPAKRYNLDTVKKPSAMTIMKIITQSPTPTIDPSKESTYKFFDGFFGEMAGLFPDAYLHIGADENNGAAWKQNPAIAAFMKKKGIKNTDGLQAYFVKRMYGIAKKYNKRLIGWEEAFDPALPADVIIQKWKPATGDSLTNNVIHHNNQLIISNGFYLDLSMPAYIHYLDEPVGKSVTEADAAKGIMGVEAALWSELVNAGNEEIRAWPRAAAIAERMWSPGSVNNPDDMYRRLWTIDFELNDRGLQESSNYTRLISRWVNGADITPVQTLTDLCVPVKGYRRLMAGMFAPVAVHPNLASPMVNIADVVRCDSQPRWYFRRLVRSYLATHSATDLAKLKVQLQLWQDNNVKFNALLLNSPYLQQIVKLSDHLSEAAAIGLQTLNGQGDKTQLSQLKQMETPVHEVQLSVLPEIEALVSSKLEDDPVSYSLY